LSLGYPPLADERALLMENRTSEGGLASLPTLLDAPRLAAAQAVVADIVVGDLVADYVLAIVTATRRHADIELPCSPRGSLAWASLCRAIAFMDARSFVTPDDVKKTAHAVLGHRLGLRGSVSTTRRRALAVVDEILATIPVPR
jgi:MoxR-like ATPase